MDQNVMTIVMLVIMLAVFYFMLIRPENKRKKAAEKMRSELAVGDVITTIGGIVGTICAVKESNIVRAALTGFVLSSRSGPYPARVTRLLRTPSKI